MKNLASRTLGPSLRRLSADWRPATRWSWRRRSWIRRGSAASATRPRTGRGWGARRGSRGTTARTRIRTRCRRRCSFVLCVRTRRRLADPVDRAEWSCRATPVRYAGAELRSLRDLFAAVPDSRRGQGRKHGLDQRELRALGAWRAAGGRWTPPADSTICRALADTDLDTLADMLRQWAVPRLAESSDLPARGARRLRGLAGRIGERAPRSAGEPRTESRFSAFHRPRTQCLSP